MFIHHASKIIAGKFATITNCAYLCINKIVK